MNTINILGKEYNVDEIKGKYEKDFFDDIVEIGLIKTPLGTFQGTIINVNLEEEKEKTKKDILWGLQYFKRLDNKP